MDSDRRQQIQGAPAIRVSLITNPTYEVGSPSGVAGVQLEPPKRIDPAGHPHPLTVASHGADADIGPESQVFPNGSRCAYREFGGGGWPCDHIRSKLGLNALWSGLRPGDDRRHQRCNTDRSGDAP